MTPNAVRKDKNGFEDPDIVSLSMTERIKKKKVKLKKHNFSRWDKGLMSLAETHAQYLDPHPT